MKKHTGRSAFEDAKQCVGGLHPSQRSISTIPFDCVAEALKEAVMDVTNKKQTGLVFAKRKIN